VLEPETRPLHACFEDAGVSGALRRLHARMCIDFASVMDQQQLLAASTMALPAWVHSLDFDAATARCDARLGSTSALVDAMELVRAQRRATEMLHAAMAGRGELGPEPAQPVRLPTERAPELVAAAVRQCHGEMLEAYAAHRALQLCDATSLPPPHAAAEFARLCHDSYLVAVWTSAHAEYAATVEELLERTARGAAATAAAAAPSTVADLLVPPPELHSVPCASNGADLSALYERVGAPRACPKTAQGLLAIFARATNAGSRGWESTLNAAVKDSDGATRVCLHALGVALTGLQPCLHPAARRPWPARFAVSRCWRAPQNGSATAFRDMTKRCPAAIKEAVRLQLAMLLAEEPATLEALAATHQPAGQLGIPPRSVAPAALQGSMHAFAAAGEALLVPGAPAAAVEVLASLLAHESRSRKKARPAAASAAAASAAAADPAALAAAKAEQQRRLLLVGATPGAAGSGGKRRPPPAAAAGPAAGPAAQPLVPRAQQQLATAAALCPAVAVVSGLLSACFRAEYVPFWLHSQRYGQRASRLDEAQFRALHAGSPAHRLCAQLPAEARLRAQRLALREPASSLLTVAAALELLGIAQPGEEAGACVDYEDAVAAAAAEPEPEPSPLEDAEEATTATCATSSRAVQEAEALVLGLGARDAATLIEFARCSALRAQLLAYDLGPRTRAAQAEAVCRRLLLTPRAGETAEEAVRARLPAHCSELFCCSECRRIANACQDGAGKDVPFNEIGLSASMLRIDGALCGGHMRCAKRSSAALRTAVALEEAADAQEVESKPLPPDAALPADLRPASIVEAAGTAASGRDAASEVAKLRRDIKNCYEQRDRAVACGDVPLVRIPVLGRAVRVFGDWHALCVRCGCLAKLAPGSRFGAEPCCMRCDFAMLHGREAAKAAMMATTEQVKAPVRQCRYCGKQQSDNGTLRWKSLPAPADAGGPNANVPPPLRVVHYCPTHFRSWLEDAHRELPTPVIFAHIIERARPMFGAEAAASAPMARASSRQQPGGRSGGEAKHGSKAMRSITKKLNASRRQRQQRQGKGRTTRA